MNRPILLISVQRDLDVIGLKSLHYHLMANSWDSRLLFLPDYASDASDGAVDRSVCEFASELAPSFVGISLMSVEYQRAVRLTRVLKAGLAEVPVVWGGIHPTISPEKCLQHADYVCVGEGETTLLELAKAFASGADTRRVNNLCYVQDGRVVRNPLNPLVADLDGLSHYEHVPVRASILTSAGVVPLDVRSFRRRSRYGGTTYSAVTSRGCPFSCTYCCNNALAAIYGARRVRYRSLARVVEELRDAVAANPFIEYVNFQDDCFLARPDAALDDFCSAYRAQVGKPFIIRSVPTFVTERKIRSLKEAGLAWISIGLQSGSDRTCREIYKRRSTRADFLRAARVVSDARVAAFYDVMLDNPFEDDSDRIQTARTLAETPGPFYTQLFSLTMYPGTALYDKALDGGLIDGPEYQTKDYFAYERTPINSIIGLAPLLGRSVTRFLLRLYAREPHSRLLRLALASAKILVAGLLQPIAYFRVVKMSQGGSLLRALRVLPNYFKEAAVRFRAQFFGTRRRW